MSFEIDKYKMLSRENKIKKVLYAVMEYLNRQKPRKYAVQLLEWLIEIEGFKIRIPARKSGWNDIYNELINTLRKENPYLEEYPFDRKYKNRKLRPIKVIIDNIRAPYNVGSIIRSSECFGINEVIICGISPAPDKNTKINRASMNAEISWRYMSSVVEAVNYLKENNYMIIAIEKCKGSRNLSELKIDFPAACILGNEEFGISKDVLDIADRIVHIDMHGNKNSLNVSVACGIVLFEIAKRFNKN